MNDIIPNGTFVKVTDLDSFYWSETARIADSYDARASGGKVAYTLHIEREGSVISFAATADKFEVKDHQQPEKGYRRGREDYRQIEAEAVNPATDPVEVDRDLYWEMLEVLPPIYTHEARFHDFLVMEPITGSPIGPVHAHFAQRGGRYFARYSVRGRPETYIPDDYRAGKEAA